MPVSVTTYGPYVEMPDSISSRPVAMTSRDSLDTTPTRTDTVASPATPLHRGENDIPAPADSTPHAAPTQPLPAGDNPSAQIATPLPADTTATNPQPLTQAGGDTTPPLVAPLPADTLTGAGTPADSTPHAATTQPLPAGDNPSAQIATPPPADTTATCPQPLTQAGGDTTQFLVAPLPADTLTGAGTPTDSTPHAAATQPLPAGDNPSAQIATPLPADTTATNPQPLTQAGGDTTPPLVAPLPTDTTQTVLDTVGTVADTVTGQEYIPTIPLREGLPGRERTGNAPLHDDTFFALLLAGLVVFLLFIRHRKRILSWQSDGKTEHYRDSNRSKHLLGINAHLRNLFLAYTFLVEGALGAIALFVVGQPLPLSGGYAVNALLLALPAALYFLLQQGIFVLLAAIFSSDARGREWCDTHLIINLLLGIGLFPFAFVATYLPEAAQTCLICAIILYLLTRILFIIKGVKLFLRDFRCLLYFILYLCALEIAPLLLAGKSWGIL